LIQGPVNANKNFLREILGGVGARSETVGKVIDPTGITLDNFFPGRTVSSATSAN
jgi:hypothetical protein